MGDVTSQEREGGRVPGRGFHPLGDAERALLARLVPAPPGGAALDVGCGTGELAGHLADAGYRVDAVDRAAGALARARAGCQERDAVAWLCLDIEGEDHTGLREDGYDLITLRLVCAALLDRARTLRRLAERLRPGGALVVITPSAERVPADRRGSALDEQEIELLAEGWEGVRRCTADGLTVLVLRGVPGSGADGGSGRPERDDSCRERGQPRDMWSVAATLARTFDAHGDAQGMTREQQWTLQVLKLSEETGEAAQAVIGVQGTNPRKGYSHGWEDVHAEVADVVITGLVALARMRPDDAADHLVRQLAQKAARFPTAGRPGRGPSPADGG